jgi:esterase/lipase superfamily enzyme
MEKLNLYYATNRNHIGKRWRPRYYGSKFSDDGMENLRFGKLSVSIPDAEINEYKSYLATPAHNDHGDGEKLAGYLTKKAKHADIHAYKESLNKTISDTNQARSKFGSQAMFAELQQVMQQNTDILIYIHGFNVNWFEAVGSALSLQAMLNREGVGDPLQQVMVVLFSWPSDGMALPFASYKSDRSEAQGSGYAVGRGILKVRDFLADLRDRPGAGTPGPEMICGQELHLLCHSMGNYVLQNALQRIREMNTRPGLPRMFEHIFMCAPDVGEDILEPDKAMGNVHQLCRNLSVYHNRGDVAMYISDYTKGNPERLGTNGASRPSMLHNKIHQIDCSSLVTGAIEHSYYLWGPVNTDIRLSIDGTSQGAPQRKRQLKGQLQNVWHFP